MGLRRTLVKLFNLVYIAAAGVSIYSICTKDLVKVNIKVDMTSQQVSEFVGHAFNKKSAPVRSEYTYTRAEEAKISDWLTQEKIAEAFDKGLHLSTNVTVPFTKAFEFKNKNLAKELVVNNIEKIVDEALDVVTPAVHKLFREGAEHYALTVLEEQLNDTIDSLFPSDEEQSVPKEEVQEIFDNVYALVEKDDATVDDIASTILGEDTESAGLLKILEDKANENGEYFLVTTNAAEIEAELAKVESERTIFVHDGELFRPVFEAFNPETEYFIYKRFSKVNVGAEDVEQELAKSEDQRKIFVYEGGHFVPVHEAYVSHVETTTTAEAITAQLEKEVGKRTIFVFDGENYVPVSEPYNELTTYYVAKNYYEEYDSSKVNAEYIAQAMVDELANVPGLVTVSDDFEECSPNQAQVEADLAKPEADRTYFIKVEEQYVRPSAWDPTAQYYKHKVIVNDVESAISALLDAMLNGGSTNNNKSLIRKSSKAEELSSDASQSDLRKVLSDYINKYLPLAKIESFSAQLGNKTALILLAVLLVFALPWIWFALVTLIRFLSPRKIWTRTGIIFFWAIPQVILGLTLTYGLKYGLQVAGNYFAPVKSAFEMIDLNVKFSCLIPSFIYLGMIPVTIIYLMLAHPFKVQYKFEKRMDLLDRHRAQREARRRR